MGMTPFRGAKAAMGSTRLASWPGHEGTAAGVLPLAWRAVWARRSPRDAGQDASRCVRCPSGRAEAAAEGSRRPRIRAGRR